MSRVNAVLNTEAPDIEPLSPLEKLALDCPHVLAIIEDEERLAEEAYKSYETYIARQHERRAKITEALTDLARNEASAKPSAKLEERLNGRIEKLRADLRAGDLEHEAAKANRPGSAMQALRENFLNTPAVHGRFKPANTTDELAPGKTPRGMADQYREQRKAKVAARTAIIKATLPRADIEPQIARGIRRAASRVVAAELASIRRPTLDERTGRFTLRGFELPTVAVVGATTIAQHGDGMGLLCALFPTEVTERLTAMALANHDESKALSLPERVDRLREIDAAILAIDYKLEYWHRVCRAEGSNSGARVSVGSPLAVLAIVPA